ncbi:hypothetical protein MPH_06004 [Macrophomina phaseolina MS6]|uniref:Uncharacterized protein n=2 Tax=Macrophomina phaseolina TaxID=35725 RepID=K2R3A8_MACPH|nr:hypothetical protein MPH_06004 [Macrophomina phaseolina MS6]
MCLACEKPIIRESGPAAMTLGNVTLTANTPRQQWLDAIMANCPLQNHGNSASIMTQIRDEIDHQLQQQSGPDIV